MKIVFIFNFLLFGALARADEPSAAPRERLAALVEYVAADYAGAVKDGAVIAAAEYEEQLGLVREAKTLPERLQPLSGHARSGLLPAIDKLERAIENKQSEAAVVAACRAIRRLLIDDYGLVLSPAAPPSLERAQALFAQNCASCHGPDGHADTAQGRLLKPPPASFYERERLKRISPALAFSAITFGVPNTGMAAFDSLPASDRWSLAFWVVGLRHQTENHSHGGALAKQRGLPITATASRLATLTDEELDGLLAHFGAEREAVVAYLRTEAPYATAPGGTFAEARRLLAALNAIDPNHPQSSERRRDLAIAAYLEGVEPHEATLRSRDRALCQRIEAAFVALRQAIDQGETAAHISEAVLRITLFLDRAEELSTDSSASVPFLAALTIALREGFEWSLLIAALLAFVRKSGRAENARFVHYGWIAALPAGACTWFVIGYALGGAQRELSEGILTLFAAALLLLVNHLVLGQREARRWLRFLEKRTRQGSSGRWPLFALAFIAAYREAIEIVLFFRALVLDTPTHKLAIYGGALIGVLLLGGAIWLMTQFGRRLSPRPVMLISSVVLTVLAISLCGQGVRALQEGGFFPLHPLAFLPTLAALGLYPTREGLLLQSLVLLLALLPSVVLRISDSLRALRISGGRERLQ